MSAKAYEYSEQPAAEELHPWVLSYWSFVARDIPSDVPPFTVWPDGCLSISFIPSSSPGPRILTTGPRVTAMHPPITPRSMMFGIRFWPDAIAQVTGIPARALRDALGPAPAAISERFAPLLDLLPEVRSLDAAASAFNASVRHMRSSWEMPDAQVRRALQYIVAQRGEVQMADVASGAALSLRQLQRRFLNATGLTLREWARVRRLRESPALHLGGGSGWSTVAAGAGFADQAHLSREFVALTGLAPRAASKLLATITHRDVTP